MDYYLLLILLCNSCGQSLKFLFTVVVQIRVCLENGVKFHELKSFAKTVFQLNQSPRTVLEEQSPVTRRFGFSFCFSCFHFTQRWLAQQSPPFDVLNSLRIFFFRRSKPFFFSRWSL